MAHEQGEEPMAALEQSKSLLTTLHATEVGIDDSQDTTGVTIANMLHKLVESDHGVELAYLEAILDEIFEQAIGHFDIVLGFPVGFDQSSERVLKVHLESRLDVFGQQHAGAHVGELEKLARRRAILIFKVALDVALQVDYGVLLYRVCKG
mmetsp:Transcript_10271/g.13913  ORF Transcript_10271/g.13913 Transcript_10271/m.13913 type:complete len:151 (+) Transcript_10271:3348-3800(+)